MLGFSAYIYGLLTLVSNHSSVVRDDFFMLINLMKILVKVVA
jgi:hypothetical protein